MTALLATKGLALRAALFEPPPRDFPCALLGEAPDAAPSRSQWLMTLVLLLLVWFVPRAVMAVKLDTICRDGVFYIQLARDLDEGRVRQALDTYRFNVYPVVLMLLHRAGLDWETAGRWFGVVMSTLLVLPLFGWLAQHYDRRIAFITCVLIGMHPKLIEWSPEIIREPLFLFLFMACLYLLWRAVIELRLVYFLAAGLTATLALNTRFEGWLLLVPLAMWPLWRGWREPQTRRQLALGVALCLFVYPAFLLTLNVTWLRDQPRWEFGNFQRLQYVQLWIETQAEGIRQCFVPSDESNTSSDESPVAAAPLAPTPTVPGPPSPPSPPSAPQPAAPSSPPTAVAAAPAEEASPKAAAKAAPAATMSIAQPAVRPRPTPGKLPFLQLLWLFVHTMERGLSPVYALLMFFGLYRWRHLWLRPNILTFWFICAAHLAGVWVHLWFANESSSRYALLIVLLGSGWIALAVLQLSHRLQRWLERRQNRFLVPGRVAMAAVIAVTLIGGVDALTKKVGGRRALADLGRWMRDEFGPHRSLIGPSDMAVLLPYYAEANFRPLQTGLSSEHLFNELRRQQPDLVLFSGHARDREHYEATRSRLEELGLHEIDVNLLPEAYRHYRLLARQAPADRMVKQPASEHR